MLHELDKMDVPGQAARLAAVSFIAIRVSIEFVCTVRRKEEVKGRSPPSLTPGTDFSRFKKSSFLFPQMFCETSAADSFLMQRDDQKLECFLSPPPTTPR